MFGLSPIEFAVIIVVAILIFGPRLPQVAAEAAGWIVKLKRSLNEIRRDSGIDREIAEVRREVENAVPRDLRSFDPRRAAQEGAQRVTREVAGPVLAEAESLREEWALDRREPAPPRDANPDDAPTPITPAEPGPPPAPPSESDPQHHP